MRTPSTGIPTSPVKLRHHLFGTHSDPNKPLSGGTLPWHKFRVPRYSFITWMAILNKLQTLDRIAQYSLSVDPRCCLCNNHNESHAHFFFECGFTRSVLRSSLTCGGWTTVPTKWPDVLNWALRNTAKGTCKWIIKLAITTTVYTIWNECNSCLHANPASNSAPYFYYYQQSQMQALFMC